MLSGSPAPGDKAEQVQGQRSCVVRELDQRPVTADVGIAAGAAGYRQLLVGRSGNGEGLDGDAAARQPEYAGGEDHGFVWGQGDDHVGDRIVADELAVGEELVVSDGLVAKGDGG